MQLTRTFDRMRALVLPVASALCALAPEARAGSSGCDPEWLPTFGERPGSRSVNGMALFDDGSGPALYVGGSFQTCGATAARDIARWDGESWSALPAEPGTGGIHALAVFDGGDGPELYAARDSSPRVTRYDGTSWTPVGDVNDVVRDLVVHDDGSGPALYAAGQFSNVGGLATAGIARWDGSSWSSVGGGTNLLVNALAVFDDGGGAKLYAGGRFTTAGGVPANRVACWDGSAWSAVGHGFADEVLALGVWDDGVSARLVAGGKFLQSGGGPVMAHIAAWDGAAWSSIGGGMDDSVSALATYDDGSGPALYAGGSFSFADLTSATHVARWDGTSWSDVDGGANGGVATLFVGDLGAGETLLVGGVFLAVGSLPAHGIATWDGAWGQLGSGVPDVVTAVARFDDGGGEALIVAGEFTHAGTQPLEHIGAWDGTTWSPLGAGLSGPGLVNALVVHDDGGGAALYAGGDFTHAGGIPASHVARWDGASWSPLGAGIGGSLSATQVHALAVYDDGGGAALYAGGRFDVAGGAPASLVARWDGTSWSPLGAGIAGGAPNAMRVLALAVYDDGNGEALYAAGQFATAGGAPADRIARWDGTTWTALGSGLGGGVVETLVVWDDGNGPALFAAGDFMTAGGSPARRIARWDGTSWSTLGGGTGPSLTVNALAVHDDGNGPALYAAGRFHTIDDVVVNGIGRWDGASWSPLGGGVIGTNQSPYIRNVLALTGWDGAGGPALYIGGGFTGVPESGDSHLARWGCEPEPTTFCFGTAELCPCGNGGAPGRGCDNAQGTGGVELALVAQSTAPNGASVTGTGFSTMGAPTALVFRSHGLEPSPVVFGDGLRCIAPTGLVRLAATTASGGTSTHAFGHGAMVGGGDFYYQIWYRNQPAGYCGPFAFNLSNGLRISWP